MSDYNFSTEIEATLRDYVKSGIADTIANKSVGLQIFTSSGRTDAQTGRKTPMPLAGMMDSGETLRRTLRVARSTAKGSIKEWGVLNVAPNRQFDAAQFTWARYYAVIPISFDDTLRDASQEALFKVIEKRTQNAMSDLADMQATGIYNSTASKTGYQLYGLDGLRVLCSTNRIWGNITDVGNSWWTSQVDGTEYSAADQVDPTSPNYLLAKIQARLDACREKPDIILTTPTLKSRLHDIIQEKQRIVNESVGQYGWKQIGYKGIEIYADPDYCPSGYMFFLSQNGVDTERSLGLMGRNGAYYHLHPDVEIHNQLGKVRRISVDCTLYCDQPRFQGALTNLEE